MTLDEAITHCLIKANDKRLCAECQIEHAQLAAWLIDLKRRKLEDKIESYKIHFLS